MRYKWTFALALIGLLAACGTPQEQCIRRETGELRKVDRLISSLRVDIERGYRLRTETYMMPVWQICEITRDENGNIINTRYCWERETRTRQVPEAIDPAEERRKLAALDIRRKDLARIAASAIEACRITYPE
jgi:hypothetical protein